jgi:phenylpropionate dioxygenase-like ring-hydroxylating dioxygenase large terminal subunit
MTETLQPSGAPGPTYQQLLLSDPGPVAESLRRCQPYPVDMVEVPKGRYLDREFHELEKELLWRRVWQVACREEELSEVGSCTTYDICDDSLVLVRAAEGEGGIRAYRNACLHRGRRLCDGPSHLEALRCQFHGFTWSLTGELARLPTPWDFPHVEPADWKLPQVLVGTWGGFVFVNFDETAAPLEDFIGELPALFDRWPLEQRYMSAWVQKEFRANWKIAQEAFMEGFHIASTHPQALASQDEANTQVDVFGNVARAVVAAAVPSTTLRWSPTEQDILDSMVDRRMDEEPDRQVSSGTSARVAASELMRTRLRRELGSTVDALAVAELLDSIYFTLFPNFHPWGGYSELCYRFRPNGDDHRSSIMDVMVLSPFSETRPAPATPLRLGPDASWMEATKQLGPLARILDQDDLNIEAIAQGLAATTKESLTLSVTQEAKIRHFHDLLSQWVAR